MMMIVERELSLEAHHFQVVKVVVIGTNFYFLFIIASSLLLFHHLNHTPTPFS
jgi:hypothetical protein